MGEYSVINRRLPRLDAPVKASGKAKYTDDLIMTGMLYGALLQSPLAHAKILNIDTSKARKLPGVKSVVTAEDAGVKFGVSPARYDETIFAQDKVRYVGDEIAAVAAVNLETALEAVSLIKVDYEELPAVFTVEEAIAEGAPLVHEKYPRNMSVEVHWEFGDVDAALKESDLVRTDTFMNKWQNHASLEPHSAIGDYDHSSGRLTLYASNQTPHYTQRTLAMALRLPVGRVRVVTPYVGGGFGAKGLGNSMEMACCLLSMKTSKPVKIIYSREQVFLYNRARHKYLYNLTTGVKKDGTIMALKNECYMDGGAYTANGIATIYYSGSLLSAPYKLANMKYDGYRLYTNKPACAAQRGHGGVAARAAWEQQLDCIAEELSIDPIEFRLKNSMEAGATSCNGFYMSSFGNKECLEAVAKGSDWKRKRGNLPKAKGIGVACGFFVSGAAFPIYRSDIHHSTVEIKLADDGGTATVYTGSVDIGQGSDTTLALIAAETLGIPYEDVRVESGSTDFPVDLGAYSSRQTLMTGNAAKEAAESVKRQVLEVVAEKLSVSVQEMDIKNGFIVFRKAVPDFTSIRKSYRKEHKNFRDSPSGDELTFKEAARMAIITKGSVIGVGKYKPDKLGGDFKGATVGTSPAYAPSAQVAEVTVDLETGKVTVDRVTDAHDCGFAINKTSVEGQVHGSVSMGLGEALFEEVKYDEKGRILNPNFGEYKIPTALDMPDMKSIIVESNEPAGPYGAKEVGEGAILPTIPAILNAVYDAIGVRIRELPLTPERVYTAIKAAEKKL